MMDSGPDRGGIVGIILAGGRSRRMGGQSKALKLLAGKPMAAHVIGRLAPHVDACVLNINGGPDAYEQLSVQLGVAVTPDAFGDYAGPLAGLLSGMVWARRHRPATRWLVTAPCDTPFLPLDYVPRLVAAAGADEIIVIAASGGRHHFASGLWPISLAADLADFLAAGERRIQSWIERHPNRTVDFPIAGDAPGGHDPFFNVNTPEDFALAETIAKEFQP